jgi:hypothetical protein
VKLPVQARSYAWSTDWLVNCTGTDPHLFRRRGPLMDALMARGTAHPGPIDMGVATDDRGRALDARGRPSDWLCPGQLTGPPADRPPAVGLLVVEGVGYRSADLFHFDEGAIVAVLRARSHPVTEHAARPPAEG